MDFPIHPFFVHFPVACLPLSVAASLLAGNGPTAQARHAFAWRLWQIGTAGAVLASSAGLIDHFPYRLGPHATAIENHQLCGLATTVCALAWAMWRAFERHREHADPGQTRWGIAIALVICGAMIWTAMGGGQLVFEHAIAVSPTAIGTN